MNKRITDIFDEITPLTSSRELYEITVSRAVGKAEKMGKGTEKARRRLSRPLAVLCIIIAALTLCTVSVGAYYNWDFGRFLASWGGAENIDTLDKLASKVTVTNEQNTFENLDISIRGALKDDDLNMIFVDFERTDGGVFDNSEYTVTSYDGKTLEPLEYSLYSSPFFDKCNMWHTMEWDEEHGYYTNFSVGMPNSFAIKDDDPLDNIMTIVFSWRDNKTAKGSTLEFNLSNIKMPRYRSITQEEVKSGRVRTTYEITDYFEGTYHAVITLEKIDTCKRTAYTDDKASFKSARNVLTKGNWEDIKTDKEYKEYVVLEEDYAEYAIDYVSVSSMKLSFDLRYLFTEADNWTDDFKPTAWRPYTWCYDYSYYINMKDGSSFKAPFSYEDDTFWNDRATGVPSSPLAFGKGGELDGGSCRYHFEFLLPYPINVDDVKSVTISNVEVVFP